MAKHIARFQGVGAERCVRDALARAGYLAERPELDALGLGHPFGALWRIPFGRRATAVSVTVIEDEPGQWWLEVAEVAILCPTVVRRSGERPLDPECLEVALVIHMALRRDFGNLRWARDDDPDLGPQSPEPIGP